MTPTPHQTPAQQQTPVHTPQQQPAPTAQQGAKRLNGQYGPYRLENNYAERQIQSSNGQTFTMRIHFSEKMSDNDITRLLSKNNESSITKMADVAVAMQLGVLRGDKTITKLSFNINESNKSVNVDKYYEGKTKTKPVNLNKYLIKYQTKLDLGAKPDQDEKFQRMLVRMQALHVLTTSIFPQQNTPASPQNQGQAQQPAHDPNTKPSNLPTATLTPSSNKPKQKTEREIVAELTAKINGMSTEGRKNRLNELNKLGGQRELTDEEIAERGVLKQLQQ